MNGVTSVRADANRRRILDVALAELLRDPEASMDQIARAAGVVRRTVYGHFPSRDALVGALVDDAAQAVAAAHLAGRDGVEDPAEAVARSILAVWPIADRYRLLVHLAQRSVTMEGIRARLSPVRAACARLIQQGLEQGRFTSPLPSEALAHVHEQVLFGLMEAVNEGALPAEEAGRAAVVAVLSSSGYPAADAQDLADRTAEAAVAARPVG
ncbi:TetR family transcriptional regulator [Streptomyces sp. SID5785]|uniref:TetR/AcrR family transcriptional regulator n=1 Tax=Streptomyces sp. SID5785 TaxID=2690309 RepID=UPI0013610563|nr:TetR/AcrR family transcriptional regulator [Streptomyces sp. SID5785]MZD08829.1 TetR family transcriptional regulator [Streptomyces sp. SID5785]